MPLILFILIVLLIAQVGFWKTFLAILGAFAMYGLFVVLLIATVALLGYLAVRRSGRLR